MKELENIDSQIVYDAGVVESDWPVQLLIKLIYVDSIDEELAKKNGKYLVEVIAVAPQAPAKKEIKSCCNSMGFEYEEFQKLESVVQALIMSEYGLHAPLWSKQGNNKAALLKLAKNEVNAIKIMFGFYMDRQINAIGNDGWDFIQGQIGFKQAS